MPVSLEELKRSFGGRLKTLSCPHCDTAYTDYAVDWFFAWREGRDDALKELRAEERDGPVKLKCELCGGKAITSVFFTPPKPV